MPVFDDWASVQRLVPELDQEFRESNYSLCVYLVDDGPGNDRQFDLPEGTFEAIESIHIIELRRNLGHQRAIIIGLSHVHSSSDASIILVMDADGEDKPSDALRLVDACYTNNSRAVVFARRKQRSEGMFFSTFYRLYQALFYVLTGATIRFGNFSAVPRTILERLIVVSEVWNHYAGGTLKSRVPIMEVETVRGKRLEGRSSMNFVSLVTHGLSAISVFGDQAGVRMLLASAMLILLALIGIAAVVVVRFFTDLAIPGWATYVVAMLLIILMQAVSLSLFFIFLVLSNRDNSSFLPVRDHQLFIADILIIVERK